MNRPRHEGHGRPPAVSSPSGLACSIDLDAPPRRWHRPHYADREHPGQQGQLFREKPNIAMTANVPNDGYPRHRYHGIMAERQFLSRRSARRGATRKTGVAEGFN